VTDAALRQLLEEIAAALGVERTEGGSTISWATAGVVFAVLGAAGAELRLDPRVAAAAARTPDAAPSPRGPDWVRFNPRSIDPHAVDRLEAWFQLGAKRAAEAGAPRRERP
jgi:hypothetical protein